MHLQRNGRLPGAWLWLCRPRVQRRQFLLGQREHGTQRARLRCLRVSQRRWLVQWRLLPGHGVHREADERLRSSGVRLCRRGLQRRLVSGFRLHRATSARLQQRRRRVFDGSMREPHRQRRGDARCGKPHGRSQRRRAASGHGVDRRRRGRARPQSTSAAPVRRAAHPSRVGAGARWVQLRAWRARAGTGALASPAPAHLSRRHPVGSAPSMGRSPPIAEPRVQLIRRGRALAGPSLCRPLRHPGSTRATAPDAPACRRRVT